MITIKEYVDSGGNKPNYTTTFLMPALGISFINMPKQFISAFIIDEKNPKIVIAMSIINEVLDPIELVKHKIHSKIIKTEKFNNEVCYIFDFPEQYIIDYNLFVIGRFSKFSYKYKELLLTHYGRITGNGTSITMVDALFADKKAKEFRAKQLDVSVTELPNGEVMSVPCLSKERYSSVKDFIKYEEGSCVK